MTDCPHLTVHQTDEGYRCSNCNREMIVNMLPARDRHHFTFVVKMRVAATEEMEDGPPFETIKETARLMIEEDGSGAMWISYNDGESETEYEIEEISVEELA